MKFYNKFKFNYKLIIVIIIFIVALIFNFLNYKENFDSNKKKLYFSEDLKKLNLYTDNCYSNEFNKYLINGRYNQDFSKQKIEKEVEDLYNKNTPGIKRSELPIFCMDEFYNSNDFNGCCIALDIYDKSKLSEEKKKDYNDFNSKKKQLKEEIKQNYLKKNENPNNIVHSMTLADTTCKNDTNLEYLSEYNFLAKLCHKNPIPKENEDSSYFLRLFKKL